MSTNIMILKDSFLMEQLLALTFLRTALRNADLRSWVSKGSLFKRKDTRKGH